MRTLIVSLLIFSANVHAESNGDLRGALRGLKSRQIATHFMNAYAAEASEALTNVYQYGVVGGAAMTAGGYVHKLTGWFKKRGIPVDAAARADLNEFFELTVDQQLALAEPEPDLSEALIELDAS